MASNKFAIATPKVDALILTALKDELDAVLALVTNGRPSWLASKDTEGCPYFVCDFDNERGGKLRIAVAWVGDMGPRHVLLRAQHLIQELEPGCLAMCGICAGDRDKVALGDVIIADQLYFCDEGKVVVSDDESHFAPKMSTFDMPMDWKMGAAFLGQEISAHFPIVRPISKKVQRSWLLSALLAEEEQGSVSPGTHPDRKTKCPGWAEVVPSGQKSGHWSIQGGRLSLTPEGREQAQNERLIHIDGLPEEPPFQVHLGTIATGSTVQQDPTLFVKLRRMNRTTVASEMEGASIAHIAARLKRRSVVIKAVSDHADEEKDDSFRAFACRASAYVLLAFLRKQLEPAVVPMAPASTVLLGDDESGQSPSVQSDVVKDNADAMHGPTNEQSRHVELVSQILYQLNAFQSAQSWLTEPHWKRICAHASVELLERWAAIIYDHPGDEGAVPALMAALWKGALEVGLVPRLAALDKRVDLYELARFHSEKKKSWELSNRNDAQLLGTRALVRAAEFVWAEGVWEPQHALAGPLFEWVWDVLSAANEDKVPVSRYGVSWWGAGGGVIKGDINTVFFWPMASMTRFLEYEAVARIWNRRYQRAIRINETLPEDPGTIDDLAFSYVEAHHKLWHSSQSGVEWGLSYVRNREWNGAVSHLLEYARAEPSSKGYFDEWARTIPLFAAPESGLSCHTAAAIIEAAKLNDDARQRLHALRLERARFCDPGKDPEQVLSAIDAESATHPWVKEFGRK